MGEYPTMFFWLLVGHALCDYPLQGDFLAKAKNHRIRGFSDCPWWIALAAHSTIHAGAVAFVTGSGWLGIAEFCAHCAIDYGKSDRLLGFKADQALHVACKVLWLLALWAGVPHS